MAFTGPEKVKIAEITRELKSVTDSLADAVDSDTEDAIQADIVTWNLIRDKHLRVKGGRDGVDLDNERKREAIRQRVRKALGLSLISDEVLELSGDAMVMLEIDTGVDTLYG